MRTSLNYSGGSIGSTFAWLQSMVRQTLVGLLHTLPFAIGWLITSIFLSTPQGEELSLISSESNPSKIESLVSGAVPLIYSLLTAMFVWLGRRTVRRINRPSSEPLIPKSSGYLTSLFILCSPMPLVLASHMRFDFLFLVHIGVGILAIGLLQRIITWRAFALWSFVTLSGLGLLVRESVTSPSAAEYIGAVGVCVLALGLWAALLTLSAVLLPMIAYQRSPLMVIAILVGLLAKLSVAPPATENSEPEPYAMDSIGISDRPQKPGWYPDHSALQAHFLKWIEERADDLPSNASIPVYLVAAEGGGLRAAAWTMAVLSELDKASNSIFSRQTFAVSGVSGGSVGLGFYWECRLRNSKSPVNCGSRIVERDFLAPALARLLFVEPIRILPSLSLWIEPRGRAFERTLEVASPSPEGRTRLAGAFETVFDSNTPGKSPPVVIFNATNVATGQRVYFSNVDLNIFDAVHANGLLPHGLSVPVSFAMHTSARFPGISSPAKFGTYTLVDGGYRENTGVPELRYVLEAIERVLTFAQTDKAALPIINVSRDGINQDEYFEDAKMMHAQHQRALALRSVLQRIQVHVIAITDNDYGTTEPSSALPVGSNSLPGDSPGLAQDLWSPIVAILSARTNRSGEAVRKLALDLDEPSQEEKQRCERERATEAERLGKKGTPAFYLAYELHYEAQSIPCESYVPRHDALIVSLNGYIQTQYPGLGWVLSKRSHVLIQTAAASAAQSTDLMLPTAGRTQWYEELTGNLCGGAGSGDVVATLSFDADGEPVCKDPSRGH